MARELSQNMALSKHNIKSGKPSAESVMLMLQASQSEQYINIQVKGHTHTQRICSWYIGGDMKLWSSLVLQSPVYMY